MSSTDETRLVRVMYVEDEAILQKITQRALETFGNMQVSICDNGANAVALARETKPQLIMLDVMMPNVDGPTTLALLNAASDLKHIPKLFLTAKAAPEEIQELRQLGAVAVLGKPFDPRSLHLELERIWRDNGAPA